jgi:hypothetical protein
MALLHARLLICEKVLREADNVLSFIRAVEVFTIRFNPSVPVEAQPVVCSCWINLQFTDDDESTHSANLALVRPSGESTDLPSLEIPLILPSVYPGMPRSVNIVMQFGIIPKEFGVHSVAIKLDGETVLSSKVILLKQEAQESPDSNSVQ